MNSAALGSTVDDDVAGWSLLPLANALPLLLPPATPPPTTPLDASPGAACRGDVCCSGGGLYADGGELHLAMFAASLPMVRG